MSVTTKLREAVEQINNKILMHQKYVYGLSIIMVLLAEGSFFGVADSSMLLFGWLPIQLGYDITYTIISIGVLYMIAQQVPDVEDVDEVVDGE